MSIYGNNLKYLVTICFIDHNFAFLYFQFKGKEPEKENNCFYGDILFYFLKFLCHFTRNNEDF